MVLQEVRELLTYDITFILVTFGAWYKFFNSVECFSVCATESVPLPVLVHMSSKIPHHHMPLVVIETMFIFY